MSSIDGSIYLSMDASHIAEDRRAISKKLRRHQMQKQSSKRQGGFEKTSQMIPNEENFNEADYEELNENLDDVQYDDFDSGDYNDSIGVLQSTLSKEGSKRSLSYSGHPGTNRQESSRLRRHTSTRSPIVDCVFNIPQIGFDIPTTQSKKKTFTSILYILLCAALLVSYAFFLESCKLMNYGT